MMLIFNKRVRIGVVLGFYVPWVAMAADTVFFPRAGSGWKLRLGTGEASVPVGAWRQVAFDDAGWDDASAPVFYSTSVVEPPFYDGGVFAGTTLTGMQHAFSCVFLRRVFSVAHPAMVPELLMEAACDDGFVAWINGVEVARYNVPDAAPSYASLAGTSVDEPAEVTDFTLSDTSMLVAGPNVLAVQVFNATLSSSDLGFMAGLTAPMDVTPPTVAGVEPPAGATVRELTRIEITFSEAVLGVEATDLLVNQTPAATVSGTGRGPFVFTLSQPPAGLVRLGWATGHGMVDGSGNAFAGGGWTHTIDPTLVEPWPQISEFLASNANGFPDEDGDTSDWLELLNPRPTTMSLDGWYLTDTPERLTKWRLPAVSLGPGARMVVFASGKDRATAGMPLHTNFSLSAAGEYLALVAADGVTVVSDFAPSFPAQLPDRSYGRPQDSGPPEYLTVPTPGASNAAAVGAGLVADTKFSPRRGLYDAPVTVSLATATPEATIRFTTNGSVPTATTGTPYTGPLTLSRTTVLRAAAFKPGCVPSNVDTHTYLFANDVLTQAPGNSAPTGWPASSVNGQRLDYAMDARIVNHSSPALGGADQVRAGLVSLPSLSIVMPQSDLTGAAAGIYVNAGQRGAAWERAASVEMLNDPDYGGGFKAQAGVRIRGNFSRDGNNPKHSFRLLFRSAYGDSKLHYPLYGPGAAEVFDALDVQSPQDFSWAFYDPANCNYLRDTWSRDTQGALGQPHARSRWLHLYLNGVYWGLYQIEERPEATFASSYLGEDDDAYDVIKNTGFAEDFHIEATDGVLRGPAGQPSAWERIFAGTRAHFSAPAEDRYFALQGLGPDGVTPLGGDDAVLLDPDNLADYLLMVMYSANTDMASSVWIGQKPNNFYGLRRRGGTRGFVWVAHDGETSLDYYPKNYDRTGPVTGSIRSEFIYSNPEFFHDDLLASRAWRTRFGDRAHRAFFNGGPLSPEACIARLDARAAELAPAIIAESARWGDAQRPGAPYTKADWQTRVAATRSWFAGRREHLITQLKADGLYPAVVAPSFSQFGGPFTPGFALTLTAPAGTIYFTSDGTDPRLPTGELAPSAMAYSAPVTLTWATRILARARVGADWSALTDATFHRLQDTSRLLFSEIHYHPADEAGGPGEELEFVELSNAGGTVIDLGLMEFSRGLTYRFPAGTRLEPGGFCLLGRNPSALAARFPGVTVHGTFIGRLADEGETLELVNVAGEPVARVRFDDDPPWPAGPDGGGPSLTLRSPDADPALPASWRSSFVSGGTPGRAETFTLADWRALSFSAEEISDPAAEATRWGDAADPDGDGFSNLLEYALGGTAPCDASKTPTLTSQIVVENGDSWLRGTYTIHEAATGITVRAEVSDDLASTSWQPLAPSSLVSQENNTALVTVQSPLTTSPRRFLRVHVTRP